MKISNLRNNFLRRVFLAQARWNNYEHPAFPKPTKQRFVDLKSEFFLSGPAFNTRASELSRSLVWALDKLAKERTVLESCKFALQQIKASMNSAVKPYESQGFKTHYEHLMFQHVASRADFLKTPDANSSFMNPAYR